MGNDFRQLRNIQRKVAEQASAKDAIDTSQVKTIAGFDIAFYGDKIVCAAVVLDAKTMKVLESKHSVTNAPMQYIPAYLAFREGPAIIQTYFDLELEPDVIMIDGHGMAHPLKCGLATYVGVELGKPTIGVAKKLLIGEEKDSKIIAGEETIGVAVKTKEHARPVYVSVGHNISIEGAEKLVKQCIVFPHKMPEPLHYAHRLANSIAEKQRAKELAKNEPTND
ncbi:MAG: endonuclease V [Candidatus Pacearchaeota archaeon]